MTCNAPARSDEQRLEALHEANRIRTYRKQVKRDLAAGRRTFGSLFDDPDLATAKVIDFALALPKFGRVKVNRALSLARVSPAKTMLGLTGRQRLELLRALTQLAPASVLRPPVAARELALEAQREQERATA